MMTTDVTLLCAICDETADDARLVSECMVCSRTFHLNPYNQGEHKDCGDAMIGPSQGIEFWCEICLEELQEEAAAHPPDPRAQLEELAAPAALFPRPRPAPIPRAPAAAPPPTAGGPPPRRSRAEPRKRYRRIDR